MLARLRRPVAIRVVALAVALVVMSGAAAPLPSAPLPSVDAPFHLRLEKSSPSEGEALTTSPKVIRLWFSMAPEMAVTSIKLADANGKAITLAAPRRGSAAKDPVEAEVTGALAAGTYTVAWKTSSKDGHPIKGTFSFSVKAGAN